jgi:hypothetical protein
VVFDKLTETVNAASNATLITFFIVSVFSFFRAEFIQAHGERIIAADGPERPSPSISALL